MRNLTSVYSDPDRLCWCHHCHKAIFLVCLQAWWWSSTEGGGGRTEMHCEQPGEVVLGSLGCPMAEVLHE